MARILQFSAENFKRIRIVEIRPKKSVTQFTGRNGQGKTSVLDAMWALFAGKRAIPDKPVRKGADKSKLKATIGDDNGKPLLIATRTIHADRTTEVKIEAAPGAERPVGTPQAILDTLIGEMSFDPIAFIRMAPKAQVDLLRTIVSVDVDLDELTKQNEADYDTRTAVNRDVQRLQTELAAMTVQESLPAEKIDDSKILNRIREADAINLAARNIDQAKVEAGRQAVELRRIAESKAMMNADDERKIEEMEAQLKKMKADLAESARALKNHRDQADKADKAAAEMPAGEYADVTALAQELQDAQLTNREIDKKIKRDALQKQLDEQRRMTSELSRRIDDRNERKRGAIAEAKMPVDGLTFNDEGVLFRGIPLMQLGEAEQIRIGATLAMAANPKLRAIPIHHGESLDDQSLALLEELADKENFQVFMARVDTTGKIGIVLADGMIEKEN